MSSVLRHSGFQSATQRPMVGDTKTSMVRADHLGWMLCDGRALSTAEYRTLFAVLEYSFGGSGATFNLPDARGHVMGLINQPNEYTVTPNPDVSGWADGDVSGYQTHTLTIAEMPAHNHDISGGYLNVSGDVDPSGNGRTSLELTGITLDVSGEHTHTATDSGHQHSYENQPYQHDVALSLTTTNTADNINQSQISGVGYANITVSSAGSHTHIVNDPTHRHQIASNGGSQPHNNMQPTVFLGNLFIYSGRVNKNVTGFDGITTQTNPANPASYFPPQQNKRLY
jgi:microcystin-dependent protein